ncbi:MAG: aldehyde dehydrogenase family protein, partial [Shimia sp.]
ENLDARSEEFAARLKDMTGKDGKAEVATSVERLFHWAAWADKVDGRAKPVPLRGTALAMREPVGVVGVIAPPTTPLLGLIGTAAPAIAMGNSVVAVASFPFPLAATDLYQVLETSDVPGGVFNILTGDPAELAPTLADHMNVDAVWSFAGQAAEIEHRAAGNLKRSWVPNGALDLMKPHSEQFIDAATEIKTIWIPYGEG